MKIKLLIIEFKIEAIVDLIVLQRDVVFVGVVPFLQDDLLGFCSRLCRNQLFEVTNFVGWIALDTDFLA